MHSRLFANLCPSIIQRVTKQMPPRTITAPPAGQVVTTVLDEDERQATFAKSRRHHFPRYAPIRFSYED